MKTVQSAGGLLYDADGQLLLIRRQAGGYGIPKGHVEVGETAAEAAVRELREETGYDVAIEAELGQVDRRSHESNGELVNKQITLFWLRQVGGTLGSIEERPEWVPYTQAVTDLYHPEEAEFVRAHPPAGL